MYTSWVDIHFQLGGEHFVWNHEKAASNKSKHGISFEEAAEVFIDPFVEFITADVDGEDREAALGFTFGHSLLYVINIERPDGSIRLISARKATASERSFYENRA
jgi:uncharacterized DUF497 family protein